MTNVMNFSEMSLTTSATSLKLLVLKPSIFFTNENQRCLMIKVHCIFRDVISDQTFQHWKHTDEDKVQEVNLFQTLERKMDFEV